MYRFQTSPQRIPGKKLWVSLLLFLFLILLFTLGTSSLSENTVRRQKESLTQALNRDIRNKQAFIADIAIRKPWKLSKKTTG